MSRTGLAWEPEERAMVDRLLRTAPFRNLEPLVTLDFTVRDLYPACALGAAWSAARIRHA